MLAKSNSKIGGGLSDALQVTFLTRDQIEDIYRITR